MTEWKDWNVSARDIVADGEVSVMIHCDGCRRVSSMNIWKVGGRLADAPLQRLRLRCGRCGMYPTSIEIERETLPRHTKILTIKLNPAFWDEGHETNQRQAKARAVKRWATTLPSD
ncbi:hypothetical protein [Brevundimonas sp. EAKA]|uniref:hypothetical protein n=1 Tax=Brevundimonas sp. EAKA TaxID=1495854 RepID=UPI0012DD835B|nr:hypothetical protein [Brevundimonas sp. EAKA]